jgi:hypothetical protein
VETYRNQHAPRFEEGSRDERKWAEKCEIRMNNKMTGE